MPWSPPVTLKPVTPEVYAQLRLYIDACAAVVRGYADARDGGCQPTDKGGKGCWPDIALTRAMPKIAKTYYDYVPASSVSLETAQKFAMTYFPDQPAYFPDSDGSRLGWPTFVDREALIAALDAVTAPEVFKQLGSLDRPPDAAGELGALPTATGSNAIEGQSWWLEALSAGGVLAWLGRSKVLALVGPGKFKKLILIAAGLLAATAGYLVTKDEILPAVRDLYRDLVKKPLGKAASIVGVAAGLGVAALIAAAVVRSIRRKSTTHATPRGAS